LVGKFLARCSSVSLFGGGPNNDQGQIFDMKIKESINQSSKELPTFDEINTPQMLCIITANGGGTKLFQSYLDNHSQIYNIPAYPMLYLYPHWETWEQELSDNWSWETIINKFCEKHASVIDSRRINAFNGLDTLGADRNKHVEIDEEQFRITLSHILKEKEITRRAFLLAVNYSYALCKGQNISKKKVLFWHHHCYEYLDDMQSDFKDAIVIGLIRDPRPKIPRVYNHFLKIDERRLNKTDSFIYRSNVFYSANKHTFGKIHKLHSLVNFDRLYFLRHEDLKLKLNKVIESIINLVDIEYSDSLFETTFDTKLWWGHDLYDMPKITGTYEGIISKDWQEKIKKGEIFVMEGIHFDYYKKYGYELLYYKNDSFWDRIVLIFLILKPFDFDLKDLAFYFNPKTHIQFLSAAYKEGNGQVPLRNYKWNATYLYKWTYVKLKLWQDRWHVRLLNWSLDFSKKRKADALSSIVSSLACFFYIVGQYGRFLLAAFKYIFLYFRRAGIYYGCLKRRFFNQTYLPKLLG